MIVLANCHALCVCGIVHGDDAVIESAAEFIFERGGNMCRGAAAAEGDESLVLARIALAVAIRSVSLLRCCSELRLENGI